MHSKALRKAGVNQAKLDALAMAGKPPFQRARVRGVSLGGIGDGYCFETHAEDTAALKPLLDHFSAREISDLDLRHRFNELL